MNTDERIMLMNDIIQMVVTYLEEQKQINEEALKPYEREIPTMDVDVEIKKMRETECFRLRDRNNELSRHIAVIKRMVPPLPKSKPIDKK